MTMTHELVTREIFDGVAVLTWNRPERNNAWSVDMETVYYRLLTECAEDENVRVIVVTGAGKSFCPGMDAVTLSNVANGAASTEPHLRTPMTFPRSIPKPVIAAINGACAGIGLTQALMCDVRFAAEGAKFTTAFSRRGLIAEYGISWILPRVVGHAAALDLLLSGRTFLADEAAELGLVKEVVAADDLMARSLAYAEDLAAHCAPSSMAVIKGQIYDDALRELAPVSADAEKLMHESMGRPDFIEGITAFFEKRPPNFPPLSE